MVSHAIKSGATADLIFVCTHNSRRSHMSQLWAQAAALSQGLDIKAYSAGTETTAFNPRAVKALKTHGFQIDESNEVLDDGNIVYDVDFGEGHPTVKNFSMKISDPSNLDRGFWRSDGVLLSGQVMSICSRSGFARRRSLHRPEVE